MKLMTLVALVLMTNFAWGSFKPISIETFNIDYHNPEGTANAAKFSAPDFRASESENLEFRILKEKKGFLLISSKGEYLLESVPPFIMSMENLKVDNINMKAKGNTAAISITHLVGGSDDGGLQMKGMSLNCIENTDYENEVDRYLDACTSNGSFTMSKLVANSPDKAAKPFDLIGFKISVKNNKFTFKTKAAGYNVRGGGVLSYKDNVVAVRLDRAKAGIFNAKNIIFNKLASIKSKYMRIEKPYIYLNIIR